MKYGGKGADAGWFPRFKVLQKFLDSSKVLYKFSCPYPHSLFGKVIDGGRTAPRINRLLI